MVYNKTCEKRYREKHKKETSEYMAKYRCEHKEQIRTQEQTYRKSHKEHLREINKKWQIKNREKIRTYQRNRYQNDPEFRKRRLENKKQNIEKLKQDPNWKEKNKAYFVSYCMKNRKEVNRSKRKYQDKIRKKILDFFGNKCANPYNIDHGGFINDTRYLQLDHKNGGGGKEIKRLGQRKVYRRALEYPEEYQLLCANCNWIKRYENNEG